jgi:outer membrane protein insertion porin family
LLVAACALVLGPIQAAAQSPTPTPAPATTPAPGPAPTPAATPSAPPRIADIIVRGNENVSADVIFGRIGSRAGELLDRDRVRQDVEQITASGLFADVLVRLEDADDGVNVVFTVLENPILTQVTITGNTVVPTDALMAALGTRAGQVLNTVDLRAGARAIERLYADRGYPIVRVSDVEINAQGALRVTVTEGRIESIRIQGLRRTRPLFVQRYLTIRENEVFNINRVNRDLRELFDTQLFENVRANPQPGSDTDKIVLNIEVQERNYRQISFGLGYSAQQGILGSISFTERNFQGMGRQIQLAYSRNVSSLTGGGGGSGIFGGDPGENVSIQYQDPWFLERGQSLNVEIHRLTSDVTDLASASTYTQRLEGGSVSVTRRLTPTLTATGLLRSERTRFTLLTGTSAPLTPGLVNALRLDVTEDTRDNAVAATRGSRTWGSIEYAFQFLGADFGFQKYQAEYVHYLPVWEGTLVGRIRLGASSGSLPLQDQYVLGGPYSIRGLPYRAARGSSQAIASVEYRIGLSKLVPGVDFLKEFSLAVFADAGGVSNDGFGFVGTLHSDFGAGLLFNAPVGPVRIDYAMGSGGASQFWLYFGHPF